MPKDDVEWPAPGTVLAERWRLCDEVIGRGAFSTVVSAMDSTNGDAVAVKLEPMSCTSGSLEREFIILKGGLQTSKYAARVIEIFHDEAHGFRGIVMERLGPSYRKPPENGYSADDLLHFADNAFRALNDLHSIGFVHRDVKPGNFCRGCPNRHSPDALFLVDFGLSFPIDPGNLQTGMFVGTKTYASVRAHEGLPVRPVDDFWSLLFTLVDIQSGGLPWTVSSTMQEILQSKLEWMSDPNALSEDQHGYLAHVHRHLRSCGDKVDLQFVLDIIGSELGCSSLPVAVTEHALGNNAQPTSGASRPTTPPGSPPPLGRRYRQRIQIASI